MATHDVEKSDPRAAEHLENGSTGFDSSGGGGGDLMHVKNEGEEMVDPLTPAERKKLLFRIDIRVTCILGLLYVVGQIDRNNLGSASIAGMTADLKLSGSRYSVIVLILFITYSTCQFVTVVLLRKVGARVFFVSIVALWGLTTISFGFVRHWYDLIPLRLILGAFEAGMFPGAIYMLSSWYTRYQLQKRMAVYYSIGTLASAFTGILAYAVSRMDGLGSGPVWWGRGHPENPDLHFSGIAGWRWLFIMFGIVTLILVSICNFFVVDFPETLHRNAKFSAPFLTEREAQVIISDIQRDREDAFTEEFNIRVYLKNARDIKVWVYAGLFLGCTSTNYAVVYFLPIILRNGLGFSEVKAQCLTAPPYLLGCLWMPLMGWLSDKMRLRSPFVIFNCCANILGLCLAAFCSNIAARLLGLFFVTAAGSANLPVILSWQQNNIRGQWKRAFCSALTVGAGGLGGFVGGTVFRTEDAPYYVMGSSVIIGINGAMILLAVFLIINFQRANKRVDSGGELIEGLESFKHTM